MAKKILKSLLALLCLALGIFFFYVDSFLYKAIFASVWTNGQIRVQDDIRIMGFLFKGNWSYVPFLIYLSLICLFVWLSVRIFRRTWGNK